MAITLWLADQIAPRAIRGTVMLRDGDGPETFEGEGNRIDLENPAAVAAMRVYAEELGYWSELLTEFEEDRSVQLQPLPREGPLSWWHAFHGVRIPDPARGRGIRVGIADEALDRQTDGSPIGHVTNLGAEGWGVEAEARAYTPMGSHGAAVTSLLAGRCGDANGYEGMAPGAEVVFAAAGADGEPALATARLANTIRLLVDESCDLISVSAGDSSQPLPSLHNAIADAWHRGTLCFFAAGNDGQEPGYPARYAQALAVAAIGRRGFAPAHSGECIDDKGSPVELDADHYLWGRSAIGPGTDFVAAGSNVVWTGYSGPGGAVSGTSYACPIAAGVAASILAKSAKTLLRMKRDSQRSEYMLSLIEAASVSTTNVGIQTSRGLPRVAP